MDMLKDLSALSREFGGADFLKGGGGNASYKNESTMWIKPSGTVLANLGPNDFLPMVRSKMAAAYSMVPPADSAGREAMIKDVMAAAVMEGETGRPSVEAPLHESLTAAFVIHTHPVMVNGMTCAKNGFRICKDLFPEMLWVDYIDPGYTLCMRLRDEIQEYAGRYGHQPEAIFLKNHGLFVAADSPKRVREIHGEIMDVMNREYKKAGISKGLEYLKPAPKEDIERTIDTIKLLIGPEDAVHVCNSPGFDIAVGPLSPDHIVYSKAYPYVTALTAKGIDEFKVKHGYSPRVLKFETGVFSVGSDRKSASLALELAEDGAEVLKYTHAFGGPDYMSESAAYFIDNWEVESYRRKLIK